MKARTTNLGHMLRVIVVVASLVGALAAVSPGTAMARSHDRDGDGLRNRWERLHSHTNPRVRDSNHNGIPDGREDPDHDGLKNKQEQRLHTDPLDADTDDDGLTDRNDDADCDGLSNGAELRSRTRPLDADTDNDGTLDGDEDRNHDGIADGDEDHTADDPSCEVDDSPDDD